MLRPPPAEVGGDTCWSSSVPPLFYSLVLVLQYDAIGSQPLREYFLSFSTTETSRKNRKHFLPLRRFTQVALCSTSWHCVYFMDPSLRCPAPLNFKYEYVFQGCNVPFF